MSSKYQEALAFAVSNAERARLAEWDAGLLRGQIGLAQQDLTPVRYDLGDREALVRSNQQACVSRALV